MPRRPEELVNRCDEIFDAGGALQHLWPMLERERILRLARDSSTGTGSTGFHSRAMDRPVLDWLLGPVPAVRLADADRISEPAAERLQQLRGMDHLHGAGEAYPMLCESLGQGLDLLITKAPRLATGYLELAGYEAVDVRAAFRVVLARAHARRGDEAACAAALLQVEADLSRSDPAEEPPWISYFGEADLADEKAHCYFDLGLHELAQREAARAISLVAPGRVRRLAIDTALLATSLARACQVEQACAVGRQAVDHAATLASFRSSHRVVLLMAELQPYADLAMVRDLAERVRTSLPPIVTAGRRP